MSYTITVRVFRANPSKIFHLVEQTNQVGATWRGSDDEFVLSMASSGTSGLLRFIGDDGERIIAAFGVHNYKRWCDVKAGKANDTAMLVHPLYYKEGTPENAMIWKQLASYSIKSAQGVTVQINYTKDEGNDLVANLIIN